MLNLNPTVSPAGDGSLEVVGADKEWPEVVGAANRRLRWRSAPQQEALPEVVAATRGFAGPGSRRSRTRLRRMASAADPQTGDAK